MKSGKAVNDKENNRSIKIKSKNDFTSPDNHFSTKISKR